MKPLQKQPLQKQPLQKGPSTYTYRTEMKSDGLPRLVVEDVATGNVLAQIATVDEIDQFSVALVDAGLSLRQIAPLEHEAKALAFEPALAPPGWKEDKLSEFIASTQYNTRASFHSRRAEYAILRDINDVFTRISDGWMDPESQVGAFFFLRSHAAYMSACSLALSSQLPEAYAVMRSCLESSLYGFKVWKHPEAASTWLNRNEDEEARKVGRRYFMLSGTPKKGDPKPIFDLLADEDADLQKAMDALYERTIDFGAHPNQLSILTNATKTERDDGGMDWRLDYLSTNADAITLCWKTVAQVGIGVLRTFSYVFPLRYAEVGVGPELERLSHGL